MFNMIQKQSLALELTKPDTFLKNNDIDVFKMDIEDRITNSYGSIRQEAVKYWLNRNFLKIEDIPVYYRAYRDDAEYMILKRAVEIGCQKELVVDGNIKNVGSIPSITTVFKFVKLAKRGNDVYKYLMKKKFSFLKDVDNTNFFEIDSMGCKKTHFLFLTLTYDSKRCGLVDAWNNIGKEFNCFLSNIKKSFGNVEFIRTWESTNHFYPHVHVLMYFDDIEFNVFVNTCKRGKNKGKKTLRIQKSYTDKIKGFWHSNVDVQGVNNCRGAIKEVKKYVTKELCSKKGDITNSMLWVFNKRAFSVSDKFVNILPIPPNKSVDLRDVSEADLINTVMCNSNHPFFDWQFVGLLRGCYLGITTNIWSVDVEKPPPDVQNWIDVEVDRQNALVEKRLEKRSLGAYTGGIGCC